MLRAVIVDDEPLAIRAVARLLAAHPEVTVAGTAETLDEAVAVIAAARPDVVFLDVDLGGGDGFDVIARLAPVPRIVFVTAHPQFAVEAFAVAAVDYLLKPIEPARMAEALARLARLPPAEPARPIELRTPRRTVFADPAAIVALLAEGDFTRVILADQPALMILRTLGQFEALLPSAGFLRVSRSVMVNLDRVRRLDTRDRNGAEVILDGLAESLPLGRGATARLRAALAARAAG